MTTLTDTALFSKKAFIWASVFVLSIVILVIIFTLGRSIVNSLFPPKSFPAAVAFGKLPKLDLSSGIKPQSSITYSLETITGELPPLASTAKVFMIGQEESSFGDLERAKIKAGNAGFSQAPLGTTGNVLKFADAKNKERVLTIDITNNNFTLESNYLNDLEIIAGKVGTKEGAIATARGFLGIFDVDEKSFPQTKTETVLYRIDGGNLVDVPALSNANLIQVNFARADLDKLPIISPTALKPKVWVLVSDKKIVAAKLSILKIEKHKFSSYPLKGTGKAFGDLKAGYGAFNKPFSEKQFPIRNVTLGYLETENFQPFLLPVYIFESDDGLMAYVSALDNAWVK